MTTASLTKPQHAALQKHLEIIDDAKIGLVSGVVTIGLALIGIREIITTGFVEWVEENCGYSKSTAYRYIEAAEVFGGFPKLGHFQDSALYVLSRNEEAAERAKKLANRGQRITHKLAEQIVQEVRDEAAATNGKEPTNVSSMDEVRPDLEADSVDDSDLEDGVDEPEDPTVLSEREPEPAPRKGKAEKEPEPVRPFAVLPELPQDVQEAHDAYKLCILRHRVAGFMEISRDDLQLSLRTLLRLLEAES